MMGIGLQRKIVVFGIVAKSVSQYDKCRRPRRDAPAEDR